MGKGEGDMRTTIIKYLKEFPLRAVPLRFCEKFAILICDVKVRWELSQLNFTSQ